MQPSPPWYLLVPMGLCALRSPLYFPGVSTSCASCRLLFTLLPCRLVWHPTLLSLFDSFPGFRLSSVISVTVACKSRYQLTCPVDVWYLPPYIYNSWLCCLNSGLLVLWLLDTTTIAVKMRRLTRVLRQRGFSVNPLERWPSSIVHPLHLSDTFIDKMINKLDMNPKSGAGRQSSRRGRRSPRSKAGCRW